MSDLATAARPARRAVKITAVAAIPAALIVSGLVVAQASYSAYSATTVNPTSNWATGTVALTDDDNNTAAFNATNLQPGSTGSKCIAVTTTGTLASTVKLYATTTPTTTKNLGAHLNLTITQGTGVSFGGGCSTFTALTTDASVFDGTLDSFSSTHTNFNNGAGTWTPTGTANETRTYKITYTVNSQAPNTTQGGTAALGFTWEAQNNS